MKIITHILKIIGCMIFGAAAIALIPLWMVLIFLYGLFNIGSSCLNILAASIKESR